MAADSLLIDFSPLLEERKDRIFAYKNKKSRYHFGSVKKSALAEYTDSGWEIHQTRKNSYRIKKEKKHDVLLEDRAWCLFYHMGYPVLNDNGFTIQYERDDGSIGKKQIDIFAKDFETIIVAECKSSVVRGRKSLQKDIHESIYLQKPIRSAIEKKYGRSPYPKIIWMYITSNIIWSKNDIERALSSNIVIVTENELNYFEAFLKHLGPAGRYQILSEFLKGQKIEGLDNVTLPAIRGKIGGHTFFSFVCSPKSLLKIAFVNHQALNHPDGRPAYQRMISSSRIKEIGRFIKVGGFFPTNILINFVESPGWSRISSKENTDKKISFGWITLPKVYRSAWIIDGQHRLYGYSHLDDKYLDQSLFVLAFDKISTHDEADLFVTINSKQKSVPKSILVNLMCDLKMDSHSPKERLSALASGVAKMLNMEPSSPFFQRFKIEGVPCDINRNLTVPEFVTGMNKSALLGRVIHDTIFPGPLSAGVDEETFRRASKILNLYFQELQKANPVRWNSGAESCISINAGVRGHLLLIDEVIKYRSYKDDIDFATEQPDKFISYIVEVARPVLNYISTASDDNIKKYFSRKYGEGGVKEYFWHLCELIVEMHRDFGPDDFKDYLKNKIEGRAENAHLDIIKLTEDITDYVIANLKRIYGEHVLPSGEKAYWANGIKSRPAKEKAFKKQQDYEPDEQLPKEAYLDLIDLKDIVQQKDNWPYFESVFNIPMNDQPRGNKYYTKWLDKFNELRRTPGHKSSLRVYSEDNYEFIDWLKKEFYLRLESATKAWEGYENNSIFKMGRG
ncbi:MAG: DGQHR domain-containing protein [Thermodesulfobacteriota bacterium]